MNAIDPISRLENAFKARQAENVRFLSALPKFAPCQVHPNVRRLRDDRRSVESEQARFEECPTCADLAREKKESDRLTTFGVPLNLADAKFKNWTADDPQAQLNLDEARRFVEVRSGFLILLGDLGTGKSHLAVSVLRAFPSGIFVKQSELLRRLRQTYRDRAAVDPVNQAQNTCCLVLDEMGLSPGGRDELPLLHDILDFRHGNKKPTVLTGNIPIEDLQLVIGDRMADRLRESAFAILTFGGNSRRDDARRRYFQRQE